VKSSDCWITLRKRRVSGPETQVFIDDPARGLQDPVFSTSERMVDGAHIVVIETPKDTIDEVS